MVIRALFLLLCPLVLYGTGTWAEETSADEAYAEGFRAFERGDYASVLRLWTPLAERGDPRAQFGLGLIYESGPGGTPTDQEEALRWYRRAARQGIPPAQNNLAIMYAEGRVVSRDLPLAVTLWRQAAEAGYGPAQLNLAVALEGGVGVERNHQEAALWYQRAEDQGLARSRTGLVEPGQKVSPGGGDEPSQRTHRPVANAGSDAPGRPPAKAPLPAPSASGPFYVQLASLRSQEGAARSGHDLATRHADLLAGLEPSVRTVDLAGKGVWHRVLFGPISSRDGAMRICAGVRARAGDCLVALPQPLADVGKSRPFGGPTPPR